MGFTIGGSRGILDIRSGARRRGRTAGRASDCTSVAEFTGLWGWDGGAGGTRRGRRAAPAARRAAPRRAPTPSTTRRRVPAGATLDEVTETWAQFPGAAVMLPVGRAFDVIDVAEAAGRRALVRLERMGLPLGPVTATPDGARPVLRGAGRRRRTRPLLYRMGWDDAALDLHALGPGTHITAPPSDRGGLGPVRWLRSPGPRLGAPAPAGPPAPRHPGVRRPIAHRRSEGPSFAWSEREARRRPAHTEAPAP